MFLKKKSRSNGETIAFPVRYDYKQQAILDSKGMMVCDIKEWERIQYLKKLEQQQDAVGEKVAKLLNEFKVARNIDHYDDEQLVEHMIFI